MTRYEHVLEPLDPDHPRHARMIEQRQIATMQSRYLEAIANPAYMETGGDEYLYTYRFIGPYRDLEPVSFPFGCLHDSIPLWGHRFYPILPSWREGIETSWKTRETGILNEFELEDMDSLMLSLRKKRKPDSWVTLFEQIKQAGTAKGLIPCMFFNTDEGCLDSSCPFIHDEIASRREREKTHQLRRDSFKKPTPRQYEDLHYKLLKDYPRIFKTKKPFEKIWNVILDQAPLAKAICAYPECSTPSYDGESLQSCANCEWEQYCSDECQVADTERHSEECFPIDQFVENDALWARKDGMRLNAADSGQVAHNLRMKARKRLDKQEEQRLGFAPFSSACDDPIYDEPYDKKTYLPLRPPYDSNF